MLGGQYSTERGRVKTFFGEVEKRSRDELNAVKLGE